MALGVLWWVGLCKSIWAGLVGAPGALCMIMCRSRPCGYHIRQSTR